MIRTKQPNNKHNIQTHNIKRKQTAQQRKQNRNTNRKNRNTEKQNKARTQPRTANQIYRNQTKQATDTNKKQ